MGETESYLIGGAVGIALFLGVVIVGDWLMRRTAGMPKGSTRLLELVNIWLVEPMREAEGKISRRRTAITGWFLLLTAATVAAATLFFTAVHALLTSGAI
jgi:hypothetical protein